MVQAWPKNPKDTQKTNFSKALPVVVAICFSFAFMACLEKNLHGLAIVGYSKPEIPRTLEESILLNQQNYGAYLYNVKNIPQVKMDNYTEANFEVQVSPGFGKEVLPLKLNLSLWPTIFAISPTDTPIESARAFLCMTFNLLNSHSDFKPASFILGPPRPRKHRRLFERADSSFIKKEACRSPEASPATK